MNDTQPEILVFTSLFPNSGQPNAGLFIRERMFRVGKHLPLKVVAPVPWFPFQEILRKWRPHFRPNVPLLEVQDGYEVFHPRFFSVPGIFKYLDGFFMAICSMPTLWRLRHQFDFKIIDAHFAYPDGYAASLIGRWLNVPVTITLRGTEARLSRVSLYQRLMFSALDKSAKVFSVSASLKQVAITLGIPDDKVLVVGNGVDLTKFYGMAQAEARQLLKLPMDVPVLVSIGGLCERKGFHRVIACLPELKKTYPDIQFLIVGGATAEGDWTEKLAQQVSESGLDNNVRFLGVMPPEYLRIPLSAANLFVLSTRNEGWANVFLEAMAIGLPVVTTDVGGNAEVVCKPELGTIVPFDDQQAFTVAIAKALKTKWHGSAIIAYAHANSWDHRISILKEAFLQIINQSAATPKASPSTEISKS